MEPGSNDIRCFARWCRAHIDQVIADDDVPALMFADGPAFSAPPAVQWHVDDRRLPSIRVLLEQLLPSWAEKSGGSQLGISIPSGGHRLGVRLLMVDEAGFVFERALIDPERIRLGAWRSVTAPLEVTELQLNLAKNAGWRDFAKWRCRHCQSVCPGEADTVPSPCYFCGSTTVERVPLETPLRDPDPLLDDVVETAFVVGRHGG